MACTALTKGRGIACNRTSGGVKYLYFSVYDDFDNSDWAYTTGTEGEIDTIDFNGGFLYRYTVPRGSTTANETITGNSDTGTLFYTPAVSMVLNGLDKASQNEIRLLGQTQVRIFAQLNATLASGNDIILCLGVVNGMSMNTGTADSGASFGDRSGYTLNFDGLETKPFPMLEDYAAASTPFTNAGVTNLGGIVTS